MDNSSILLPHGFENLKPFVERWSATKAQDRHTLRLSSTSEEREAFFDAVKGLLPDALAHLDTRPLPEMAEADQRLLNLLLVFAHVAPSVEQQADFESLHAVGAGRIRITRTPSEPTA